MQVLGVVSGRVFLAYLSLNVTGRIMIGLENTQ